MPEMIGRRADISPHRLVHQRIVIVPQLGLQQFLDAGQRRRGRLRLRSG